jgi:tetratricopeptide (TPR) repeat protein
MAPRLGLVALAAALLAGGATAPDISVHPQRLLVSICHVTVPQAQAGIPETVAGWAAGAQLFAGLGQVHRRVSTTSPAAQAYFDQGLAWLWAFNHDEATRSFARAATLDPGCALCFWGVALTIGPNYNLPLMSAPRGKVAFAALQRAQKLAPSSSAPEQALIGALAKRYPSPNALTQDQFAAVQNSYASAMRDVARTYPGDDDIVTFAAEALMTANAWKLWDAAGNPAPSTPEILAKLQTVLARNALHPGANHYFIHAMESSPDPARAIPAAERLGSLLPGAGHLVHMPAHIFQRVGRYADSAAANANAAKADLAYYAHATPLDYYATYSAHNWQFQAFADAAIGRRADAMEAIRKSRLIVSDEVLEQSPGADWVMGMIYTVLVRFGDWHALATTPAPDAKLPGLTAAWLWSRGTALAALGRLAEARNARADLARLAASAKPDDGAGLNTAPEIDRLALLTLDARIAEAEGRQSDRIALLRAAVRAEDALAYNEPSDWFVPTRHLLGRALLENHRPQEAELVYRQDLQYHPANGWATLGLSQALAARGRAADAAAARADYARIWATADITTAYSAF